MSTHHHPVEDLYKAGLLVSTQHHPVEDLYKAGLLVSTQHHPVEDLYEAGLLVSAQHHPVEDLYEAGYATKKACNEDYAYRLLMLLVIPGLSLCKFPIVLIIKYKF